MPRKIPYGCRQPAKDAESYRLGRTDLQFMRAQMENVWNMLCYYSNMPANKSGELLCTGIRLNEELERIDELAQAILTALDDIERGGD